MLQRVKAQTSDLYTTLYLRHMSAKSMKPTRHTSSVKCTIGLKVRMPINTKLSSTDSRLQWTGWIVLFRICIFIVWCGSKNMVQVSGRGGKMMTFVSMYPCSVQQGCWKLTGHAAQWPCSSQEELLSWSWYSGGILGCSHRSNEKASTSRSQPKCSSFATLCDAWWTLLCLSY